jgi:predicted membrane protein
VTLVDSPQQQQTSPPDIAPPRPAATTPQLVTGGVMILVGLLWLLERTGAIDLTVTAVLAIGTVIVGLALMTLARRGAQTGLIVFGTFLAVITLLTAAAPLEGFQGGVGDRLIEVTSIQDIESDYNLSMGKLTIDMRQLEDLEGLTSLTASVGLGELAVRVPEGVAVEVRARSGAGEVEIFDRRTDGVGVDETYRSPGFLEQSDTLTLEVAVFLGRVEVTNE